jgi:hypothetical protein
MICLVLWLMTSRDSKRVAVAGKTGLSVTDSKPQEKTIETGSDAPKLSQDDPIVHYM